MPDPFNIEAYPEMPPMTEELARKVQEQVQKTHGWEHQLWTVMIIYNAARAVLEREQVNG